MQLVPQLTAKRAASLVRGELAIAAGGSGLYLCIKVGADEEPRATLVMIPTSEREGQQKPFLYRTELHDRFPCLSYGTEWVLEYKFDDLSLPNNRAPYGDSGVLFVSGDGPHLCLDRRMGYGGADFAFVNLQTADVAGLPDDAWPTATWSIWTSMDARADVREQPLYRHQPTTAEK